MVEIVLDVFMLTRSLSAFLRRREERLNLGELLADGAVLTGSDGEEELQQSAMAIFHGSALQTSSNLNLRQAAAGLSSVSVTLRCYGVRYAARAARNGIVSAESRCKT